MILLLFALFHTLHSAPLSSSPTSRLEDYAFLAFRETTSQDSNDRTIWAIVWSCVATILACTWTALHPNIPGPYDSGWRTLKRRVVMTFYALIAPEVVSLWALIQFVGAKWAMKDYNMTIAKSKPKKRTVIQCVEKYFLSIPPETNAQGAEPWTMTHAFFVQMGGFLLCSDGKPIQVLNYARLKKCIEDGTIDLPDITEDEIQDRSKGDFISKGLVVLQTSWFILQCITRWSQKLPLSELEVVTLGFALLNGITYALWWHKPQDVGKAFRLMKKKNAQKPDEKPEAVEAVEPQGGEPTSQTLTNDSARIAALVKEPDPEVQPTLPISNDGTLEVVNDDDNNKKMEQDNILTGNSTTQTSISTPPPAYRKVKHIRRMLRADHAKVKDTWSSKLWFWCIMIPFRFIFYSLYAFLKMLEPEPTVEDGALRVSIFGSDAVDDSSYGGIFLGSCVIGTLFGAVHLLAWWSVFPTPTEQLLWRMSTTYVAGYPTFIFVGVIFVALLSEFCNMPGMQSSASFLVYNILIWTGAALYGLSRSVIIFEAVLALRDLPPGVYQDVEWTVFIPHL